MRLEQPASSQQSLPLPLSNALELISSFFDLNAILVDSGRDFVRAYYRQSAPGYQWLYTDGNWMHVPLSGGEQLQDEDYCAQADHIRQIASEIGATRILEIGCGLGANLERLATMAPAVELVGLDLMKSHVKNARKRTRHMGNLTFRDSSFEPIPADIGEFDLIFGIETLCYAKDPITVARSIAASLKPGGVVIIFDGHRARDFGSLSPDLIQATHLYELATAVSRGFHISGTWERALSAVGLSVAPTADLTMQTWPGLLKLHTRSIKGFTMQRWRFAARLLPKYFTRNAIAGLLGIHACFGDNPSRKNGRGGVRYERVQARKA